MLANGSRGWMVILCSYSWLAAIPGCAAGGADDSLQTPLHCGPGTIEQSGYCVPTDRSGDPAAAPAGADPANAGDDGAGGANDGAGGGGDAPVPDACAGPCNVDQDCTDRCAGTHCASVDGHRRCVADAAADPGQPGGGGAGGGGGGGGACADPCDVWQQCGCGIGEACGLDEAGALGCVPSGAARQGQSCAAAPCAPGYFCLSEQTCAAYCDAQHGCPAGSSCILELQDWEGTTLATLCYGSSGCDLLAPDCPAGQTCALVDGDPGTECLTPGGVPEDGVCTYADDCEAGASCVQFLDEAAAHCRAHCDLADPGACPAGRDCFDLDAGGAGVCAP